MDAATFALARSHPALSAALPIPRWQLAAFLLVTVGLASALALPATAATLVAVALMSLPFACVALLRLMAYAHLAPAAPHQEPPQRLPAGDLPRYTILVPLFHETGVVAQLIDGLARIDYPPDRLEILFILESIDRDTLVAFAAHRLAGHMRILVVPDGEPRTKPRALNYALAEATGDLIVVYDAEDLPEPDQLHRAAAAFAAASPVRLGCLQARLNIYNARAGWLAGQFTIEYSALFDAILPCLEKLGFPVLLGGTSNHFPRSVLQDVGGWDAFNVTEDADLGIRLARFGWHVGVLDSTTFEEAPARPRVWTGQRTRWLKGWMQTYLVHMRRPADLLSDLGLRRFLGLQMLMGALLFSALVHPWFFLLCVPKLFGGHGYFTSLSVTELALWGLVGLNLVGGYLAAILLGRRAVARRHPGLEQACWWMPIYWLAISLAAYRALAELVLRPHHWEKTEHQGVAATEGSADSSRTNSLEPSGHRLG